MDFAVCDEAVDNKPALRCGFAELLLGVIIPISGGTGRTRASGRLNPTREEGCPAMRQRNKSACRSPGGSVTKSAQNFATSVSIVVNGGDGRAGNAMTFDLSGVSLLLHDAGRFAISRGTVHSFARG